MGNLTEEQKEIIRDALVLLSEERIRIQRVVDESIVNSIKMDEVGRKFARVYNDLRRLLREDDE